MGTYGPLRPRWILRFIMNITCNKLINYFGWISPLTRTGSKQIHILHFIFPHPFRVDRSHYLTSSRLSNNTSGQQILNRSHILYYKQWKLHMHDEVRCYKEPTGLFRNMQLISIRPHVSRYGIPNIKHILVNTSIVKCKRLGYANSQAITYSGICPENLLTPIHVRQGWCDLSHSVWIWHMTNKYHP